MNPDESRRRKGPSSVRRITHSLKRRKLYANKEVNTCTTDILEEVIKSEKKMYVTDDAVVVLVFGFVSLPLSVATTMTGRVVASTTKMTVGHKSATHIISIELQIQRTHRRMA